METESIIKLLITGFGPFGKHTTNPSEELLQELDSTISGISIDKIILPVKFEKAWKTLKEKLSQIKYDYIISLGLAADRKAISLERVAINLIDCDIPDNDGIIITDQAIDLNGEAAHFSTLPIKKIKKALEQKKIAVELSNSAGTYLCNTIMYETLAYTKLHGGKAGFIHIPNTIPMEKLKSAIISIINLLHEDYAPRQ